MKTSMDSKLDKYLLSKCTMSLNGYAVKALTFPTKADRRLLKSGEIFRNEVGQFSFSCTYCDAVCENCQDIMNHINTHFAKNDSNIHLDIEMTESPLSIPEFVSADELKPETPNDIFQELTNLPTQSNVLKTNTNGCVSNEPKLTPEESKTKVVRIYKLKPVKPCERTFTKNLKILSKVDRKNPLTKTDELTKIKSPSEITVTTSHCSLEPTVADESDLQSNNCVALSKKANTNGRISNDEPKLTPEESKTKIVRIIKLKRVKPCEKTFAKSKKILSKVDQKNRLTKTDELTKIKSPSEFTATSHCSSESTVAEESDLKSNNCFVPSKKMKYEDFKKQMRRSRSINRCYQCEMEPRIYEPSDLRRHICQFCENWFPNHIEFETHVREVHNKEANQVWCSDFYCFVCEKKFSFRNYLVNHMKVHIENFDHLCEICGKGFKTCARLTEHLKIHEERTYECDQCGKVFKRFARLSKHFWCHNTDLSFVCKLCSKAFKMKRYLERHMAIHNNVKINCRYCDASFNFSSARRVHEKSRHNVV